MDFVVYSSRNHYSQPTKFFHENGQENTASDAKPALRLWIRLKLNVLHDKSGYKPPKI